MPGSVSRGSPEPLLARRYVTPFSLSRPKGVSEYVISSLQVRFILVQVL